MLNFLLIDINSQRLERGVRRKFIEEAKECEKTSDDQLHNKPEQTKLKKNQATKHAMP